MPITVDTSAILGYKPATTSLSDLIGMARNVQAYQQAEQVNPLLLQQQQQATRTGEINLSVAEQQDKERRNLMTFMSNPDNWQTNGRIDLDKANKIISQIAPLTGREAIGNLTALGTAQTQSFDAAQKLTQSQREMISGRLSVMGRLGVTDKGAYLGELDLLAKENPDNKDLHRLIDSYKETLRFVPAQSDKLPELAIQSSRSLLGIKAQEELYKPSVGTVGGQAALVSPVTGKVTTLQFPEQPVTQPSAQPAAAQTGVQPEDMSKPKAEQPGLVDPSKPVPLKYPVRQGGVPFAPGISEQKDTDVGTSYRTSLVTRQTDLPTVKRNLDEAEKVVTELEKDWLPSTGVFGAATRGITGFLGTETGVKYKQLSKDLANIQLANLQAQGGSMQTDSAKQLQRMASGDETYPPEVLRNIIRRARADVTNLDLQATAAEKFGAKYGDNNMASFKQMWAKNADTRIFETMNINDSNLPDEEKRKLVADLYKTEKERKEAAIKWRNLKKLIDTGSL